MIKLREKNAKKYKIDVNEIFDDLGQLPQEELELERRKITNYCYLLNPK